MSKLDIEKRTPLTKQVFFGVCFNYFRPKFFRKKETEDNSACVLAANVSSILSPLGG